jgi:hypothetical protein
MSGGTFDYLQRRYEWYDAIEEIGKQIKDNESGYSQETLDEFKKGLEYITIAQVYLERIDYLIACDDGEDNFHKSLKTDLEYVFKKNEEIT